MGYVLITGGSAGIGLELAQTFAGHGHNLILVASCQERLKAAQHLIKSSFSVSVLAIEMDLAKVDSAKNLYQHIKDSNIAVDILVNNAGFGLIGESANINFLKDQELMILNMITPVSLCKLFLNDMYRRKKGKILNIASTAAFQPGPYNSTYFASKSFLLSYTRAIRYEAGRKGVQICALCPGTTKTDFFHKEGIKTPAYAMTPAKVAQSAYRGLLVNKEIIVPGPANQLVRFIPGFLKTPFVAWLKTKKET